MSLLRLSSPLYGVGHGTILRVADDSGIIKGRVVGIFRNRKCTGGVSAKVRITVADSAANYKGPLSVAGIVIRRRKETVRKDGSYLKFSDNAMVPLVRNKPLGAAIKGPVPFECRHSIRNIARWVF